MRILTLTLLSLLSIQQVPTRQEVGAAILESQQAEARLQQERDTLQSLISQTRVQAGVVTAAEDDATAKAELSQRLLNEYVQSLHHGSPQPAVGELQAYLSSLPFASEIPTFPEYDVPTEADCEWIIEGGVARSTRGLPDITVPEGQPLYLVGPAYRASVAAGHPLPIDFGVRDDAGTVVLADGWSQPQEWNSRSLFVRTGTSTFADLRVRIVGISDVAEVSVAWGRKWGFVRELGLYNIGLRGQNDSFIIRANDGIGNLTLDGCWFLASTTFAQSGIGNGSVHASGMHVDKWDRLIIRHHKWRGKLPTDPGPEFMEHEFYLKSGILQTWIVENELHGGNRTLFQERPGADEGIMPTASIVVAKNTSDGYGWHVAGADGGAAITIWSNPRNKTFILGNTITDARYGCLVVSGQGISNTYHYDYQYVDTDQNQATPPELIVSNTIVHGGGPQGGHPQETWLRRDWLNDAGFPIGDVYVWDNVFENSRSQRATVSISATERLFWGPNNLNDGKLFLNSEFNYNANGIANGQVRLYNVPSQVWTYDGASNRKMTEAEVGAFLFH